MSYVLNASCPYGVWPSCSFAAVIVAQNMSKEGLTQIEQTYVRQEQHSPAKKFLERKKRLAEIPGKGRAAEQSISYVFIRSRSYLINSRLPHCFSLRAHGPDKQGLEEHP